jgi:hypothetical protein
MDFLHPSSSAVASVAEIPFLGTVYETSKPTSFDEYPASFGFNPILVLQGGLQEIPATEVEPFVQAWLHLGLLVEVLNRALGRRHEGNNSNILTSQHFIRRSPLTDCHVISTSDLQSYFDGWRHRAERLDPQEKESDGQYILQCLRVARSFAATALSRTASNAAHFSFSPIIQSSIVVSGSILEFYASQIYDAPQSTWPQSLIALDRLSGMCDNEKSWLMSQFGCDGVYYRSMQNLAPDQKDHSRCNNEVCLANNVVAATYITRHATESCECDWIGLDKQDFLDCLRSDDVPLISIADPGSVMSTRRVQLFKVSEEVNYVAISHVWSDGLGNPNTNALPSCQLRRLGLLAAKALAQQSAAFWIDTLCVPHKGPEKKLAIAKMKETYEKATRVVVLDNQLLQTSLECELKSDGPYNNMPLGTRVEAFMQISLSGWMRRLWTFQEAVVSRELEFQFADGLVNLRRLFLTVRNNRHPIIHQAFSNLMVLLSLRYQIDGGLLMIHLLNALRWRSTSNAEDEAICIAAIFDLSPERFIDLPLEQHMPELLKSLGSIPVGLLFSRIQGRHAQNFSWAPASFLNSQHRLDLTFAHGRSALAHVDESGLTAQLPGWISVDKSVQPLGKPWWVEETDPATSAKATATLLQVYRGTSDDKIMEWQPSDYLVFANVRMGLIVKPGEDMILPTGPTKFSKGICVAVLDENSDALRVKVICRVVMAVCDYRELLDNITIEPTMIQRLEDSQKWLFV